MPDPTPAAGETLVAVAACGVCGTDLHLFDGHLDAVYPLVPGHEFAGTVAAVGSGVDGAKAGDLVVADPNLPCGRCHTCRKGHSNLCEDYRALGVTLAGGFAELVAVPADKVRVLPSSVPPNVAALAEPLACAVHAVDRAGDAVHGDALVYGAGPMGLLLAFVLRARGSPSVGVVDRRSERVAAASALGVRGASRADLLGDRWELVVDATGSVTAIEDGLTRVRTGGTFLVFGVAQETARAAFRPFDVYRRELTITGSMAVGGGFDAAVELLSMSQSELGRLVTDRVPLSGYGTALDRIRAGKGLKHQLVPPLG